MQTSQITIQDCGCLALPAEVNQQLGLGPGTLFAISANKSTRTITLKALTPPSTHTHFSAPCPVPGSER